MVTTNSDMMSQGEVESPMRSNQQQQPKNQPFPLLGRQSSIYSLTLDEFQHTLNESGKNFGSMNMDEFLNSIWSAEENHAQGQGNAQPTPSASNTNAPQFPVRGSNVPADRGLGKQMSLSRQGSITVPEPLCRKTVEEVWSEIHKDQQQQNSGNQYQNPGNGKGSAQRQATFGEMTLEDFLVKAGVVREQNHPTAPPPPQQQPYGGVYQKSNLPNFSRHVMGVNAPNYQGGIVEAPGYPGGMKASGGGYGQRSSAVGYGGRIGNSGAGGFGGVGMGSPVSPVSSDGFCGNQVEIGGIRGGRKRAVDGPVEKVVERRQRRMIKNRESAARSRARKQAYTVELEAELNQLKEENAHLKQALADLERARQQYMEEVRMKTQVWTKAEKANDKSRTMRRSLSCPNY